MLRLVHRVTHRHLVHPTKSQIGGIHSRNKKATELIAKGWSCLQEIDRVIDHADTKDTRLLPLLRTAKENFELALEVDNMNTRARYWLARLHFDYHIPQKCQAIGAALLAEAANMGDAEAQYELGCRLRAKDENVKADQQAFYYIEMAVDQLHAGALYLLGAVYLTGDCVPKDVDSAMWCFHKASEKGHAGAAIACGSLIMQGTRIPESIHKMTSLKRFPTDTDDEYLAEDRVEEAKRYFEIAAKRGRDLGFKWLDRVAEYEKYLQNASLHPPANA